ncbi:MAG: hypothetical protein OFPII_07260 [Osedax symbiont Rs1]|nr:MAG: hypothetical protein OFPII_07260 [Osedax symbiont Rs1]
MTSLHHIAQALDLDSTAVRKMPAEWYLFRICLKRTSEQ